MLCYVMLIKVLLTRSFPLICPINNHWPSKGRIDDIKASVRLYCSVCASLFVFFLIHVSHFWFVNLLI